MQTATSPKGLKLLSTTEVCVMLGVSVLTLWRRRDEGYFQEGYHFIRIGTKKRSSFRWTSLHKFTRKRGDTVSDDDDMTKLLLVLTAQSETTFYKKYRYK